MYLHLIGDLASGLRKIKTSGDSTHQIGWVNDTRVSVNWESTYKLVTNSLAFVMTREGQLTAVPPTSGLVPVMPPLPPIYVESPHAVGGPPCTGPR